MVVVKAALSVVRWGKWVCWKDVKWADCGTGDDSYEK